MAIKIYHKQWLKITQACYLIVSRNQKSEMGLNGPKIRVSVKRTIFLMNMAVDNSLFTCLFQLPSPSFVFWIFCNCRTLTFASVVTSLLTLLPLSFT